MSIRSFLQFCIEYLVKNNFVIWQILQNWEMISVTKGKNRYGCHIRRQMGELESVYDRFSLLVPSLNLLAICYWFLFLGRTGVYAALRTSFKRGRAKLLLGCLPSCAILSTSYFMFIMCIAIIDKLSQLHATCTWNEMELYNLRNSLAIMSRWRAKIHSMNIYIIFFCYFDLKCQN